MRVAAISATVFVALAPLGAGTPAARTPAGALAAEHAQTGRSSAVPRTGRVPFAVGETLTYDVTWSSYLVAGTAVTAVRERRRSEGADAYAIVAEGRPVPLLSRLYNLYYKMDTLLDSATLLPRRSVLYAEEGRRKRTTTTDFNRPARRARFRVEGERPEALEFDVPTQVQDGLSAVYALRAAALKRGDRLTLSVADEGQLYRVQVDVGASERVRVPLGDVEAWNLALRITDAEGKPAASNAAVWMSTDARRLPVKLQAELPVGHFVLLLRQATP